MVEIKYVLREKTIVMLKSCLYDGSQIAPTLTKNNAGGSQRMPDKENFNAVIIFAEPQRKYLLRRLTPTECARLQGFPDWWCDDTGGSDSAQFMLWGNGIALPCEYDVLGRIVKELSSNNQEDNYGRNV